MTEPTSTAEKQESRQERESRQAADERIRMLAQAFRL